MVFSTYLLVEDGFGLEARERREPRNVPFITIFILPVKFAGVGIRLIRKRYPSPPLVLCTLHFYSIPVL